MTDLTRGDISQDFSQLDRRWIGKLHGGEVTKLTDLIINGLSDLLPSIAYMNRPSYAGDQVKIAPVLLIEKAYSFPSGHNGGSFADLFL